MLCVGRASSHDTRLRSRTGSAGRVFHSAGPIPHRTPWHTLGGGEARIDSLEAGRSNNQVPAQLVNVRISGTWLLRIE